MRTRLRRPAVGRLVTQDDWLEALELEARPLQIATPLEADHHAATVGDLARELGGGLGHPAHGEPRLGRVEGRCATRQRREDVQGPLLPDGGEDALRIGQAAEAGLLLQSLPGRRERRGVLRRREPHDRGALHAGVEHRVLELGVRVLGGGPDAHAVELPQRALGEGREDPEALDLVAEEVDAHRLISRRRVAVDDAAAGGELTTVLDLVDALVAEGDEPVDEARRRRAPRP